MARYILSRVSDQSLHQTHQDTQPSGSLMPEAEYEDPSQTLYSRNSDYYGRDYADLAYSEMDIYDLTDNYYEPMGSNNPSQYPSHSYLGHQETSGLTDYSLPFNEAHLYMTYSGHADELSSELTPRDQYPSPDLEPGMFDPNTAIEPLPPFFSLVGDYCPTLPPIIPPSNALRENTEFETLSEISEISETSEPSGNSSETSQSPQESTPNSPPTSVVSDSPENRGNLMDFLPRNVAPAQKPHAKPLKPTDPQSVVGQLWKDPSMWDKACLTKKGVFICTNCHRNGKPLSFRTMIELAVHFDSHGLMRKSKCEKKGCPWSVVGFSTRSEKNRHTKSQHSDLNYPCQICGRRFGRCDSLKRHLKLVHNITHEKKGGAGDSSDGVNKNAPPSPSDSKTDASELPKVTLDSMLAYLPGHQPLPPPPTEAAFDASSLRWTNPQGYYTFLTRGKPQN
ncbi:hypothetical protein CJU90_3196 [Yarrowia sp. C11]|nr:hypothetical protein CKK34_4644 [Yarrowia sp. E02]KAG5369695.1 hypothetical protein CJU90_3196 [Yarrowia sp. C11]